MASPVGPTAAWSPETGRALPGNGCPAPVTGFRLVKAGYESFMASYKVNRRGVAQKENSWQGYSGWFLGPTEGAGDETKARYAFVYGDFRRLHRSGLIACLYRAAEWRHKEVERAAYRLLQELDAATS